MTFFDKRRNDAVYINPPALNGRFADIHITERGSDWLWAAFSVFGLSFLLLLFLSFRRLVSKRAFHYIFTAIFLVAALTYYALASNLGFVPIPVEFHRNRHTVSGNVRQIWYARYIDWFITAPLMLLALLLTARAAWHSTLFAIILGWAAVVCGLAGALTPTRYKWGWFSFGVFVSLVLAYLLLGSGRRHATALGSDVGRTYTMAAAYLVFLWLLYPVAWGLSEGGNVISPDSEQVFYGVLDIFSKIGLAALLLWGHRKIDPARLGLTFCDPGTDNTAARTQPERNGQAPASGSPGFGDRA